MSVPHECGASAANSTTNSAAKSVTNDDIKALIKPEAIHKHVYTEQAIFDLEMERIFGKVWLYVAHESQLKNPGDFVRSRMGTQEVIVTRNASGEIHVLKNRCSHRGASVCSERSGNTKAFVCSYHAWAFGMDGTLQAVPHRQSYPKTFMLNAPENALQRAPRVESYRGFVFASLSPTGPSLSEFLGPMTGAIDNLVDRSPTGKIEISDSSFRLEYKGNWKLHHENANDTIHPGVVHESSVNTAREQARADTEFDSGQTREMLEANGFGRREWESIDLYAFPGGHSYMGGIYKSGLLARKENDPVREKYVGIMNEAYGAERAAEILNLDRFNNLVYPNISVNAQFHQLRIVHPIAPDRTLVISHCFRLIGAPDEIFHRAVRFLTNLGSPASMIYIDDAEVFERCNTGLHGDTGMNWINMQRGAGMETAVHAGGVMATATEAPIRAQYAAWLDLMTAEEA